MPGHGTCFGVPCVERISAEEELRCAWWDIPVLDHEREAGYEMVSISDVFGSLTGEAVCRCAGHLEHSVTVSDLA